MSPRCTAVAGLLTLLSLSFSSGCNQNHLSQGQAHQRANALASSAPTTDPAAVLLQPEWIASVKAVCSAPTGWKPGPPESDGRHAAVSWGSPTNETIYGVIHFGLPLPVPLGFVHSQFISEMRKREGKADEVDEHDDPKLPGIRFEVKGGQYHMRANLMEIGSEGWVIYASTRAGHEINEAELKIAMDAREHTAPSLEAPSVQGQGPTIGAVPAH